MPNQAAARARAKEQGTSKQTNKMPNQAKVRASANDQVVARADAKAARARAKHWHADKQRRERILRENIAKCNAHFHSSREAEDLDYENDDYDDPREMRERDAPAVRGLELKQMLANIIAFVLLALVVASVCRSNYEQTFVSIVR